MSHTFLCAYCGHAFHSREHDAKYCGIRCKSKAQQRVDVDRLRELAATGRRAKHIAVALGVERSTVSHALKRFGLYDDWHKRRYAWCA